VSAWANWRGTIPILAERFHVLAPDLVGFGYSERPEGIVYGKELWVEHVLAFLEAKGIARCSVVGNSLGGALALALALRRPELIERMVLMGAAALPFPVGEGLAAVWGYEPSEERMRTLISRYFVFDASIATDDLVRLRHQATLQPGFQESYRTMFPAPFQRHLDALVTSEDAIATIAAPTLLIHGREDAVIPVDVSQRLFGLLPNAQLHLFGKCGHWTQIEYAAEFNALAMLFLNVRGER
jgi:pimeloyl-ACP methyl ester carboxylesterase